MFDEIIYCTKLIYQYYSRYYNEWRTCEIWEIPLYTKYMYEVRVINGGITKDYLLFP